MMRFLKVDSEYPPLTTLSESLTLLPLSTNRKYRSFIQNKMSSVSFPLQYISFIVMFSTQNPLESLHVPFESSKT